MRESSSRYTKKKWIAVKSDINKDNNIINEYYVTQQYINLQV